MAALSPDEIAVIRANQLQGDTLRDESVTMLRLGQPKIHVCSREASIGYAPRPLQLYAVARTCSLPSPGGQVSGMAGMAMRVTWRGGRRRAASRRPPGGLPREN